MQTKCGVRTTGINFYFGVAIHEHIFTVAGLILLFPSASCHTVSAGESRPGIVTLCRPIEMLTLAPH